MSGGSSSVEIELQVLDCTICSYPLKPPVFQCAVGHVVCSSCLAKLRAASRRTCHMCGSAGAIRCCTAKTANHGKEEHEETCPHGGTEIEPEAAGPGVLPESEPQDQKDVKNKGDRNKGRNLIGGFGGLVLCISVVIAPVLHGIMRKRK
ncbi:unnamed protein product [Urochloa humidicola]